jgi:CRISPR-associated protein Csb2
MLAISLSFPAKRFHATPWGRQVNEGAVEWPPSPWRLLRALIAVWRHKFSEVPESDMQELVTAISAPPRFALPAASQAHTRHFMPAVNDKRTKVFDTFVVVDPDDFVLAVWPDVGLSPDQRNLLQRLVTAMTYFGRAESWVCGEVVEALPFEPDVFPLELGVEPPPGYELVRTLTLADPDEHAAWLASRAPASKSASGKGAKKSANGVPQSLFEALHADTAELRKAGWNQPPGSRWINYARPQTAFAPLPRQNRLRRKTSHPTVARYAVAGAVRPLLTEALPVGEQLRRFVMSHSEKITGNARTVFSGHCADGAPFHDRHRHAHFMCEALDGARITHINVFAPMGFEPDDALALSRVNTLYRRDAHELQLALLGLGEPADFGGTNEKMGESPVLHKSRVWESRTPVVLSRHLKLKRSELRDPVLRLSATMRELVAFLRREMRSRENLARFADSVEIEPCLGLSENGTSLGGHFTRWLKFRRERYSGSGNRASSQGYGFRLIFPEPIQGPITLGYGSHFGLGQFRAV